MKTFKTWLVWVLLPVWLAIYLIGFRAVGPLIFIPLVIGKGIWWSTWIAFLIYGVWGTVFYLLILQGSVFEKAREKLVRFTPKKENRILAWIKEKLTERKDQVLVPPLWVLATFIVLGVLEGVLLIRVSYPRKFFRRALLLVWVGCAVEVLTWFLPVYGGILSLVRIVLANWFGA